MNKSEKLLEQIDMFSEVRQNSRDDLIFGRTFTDISKMQQKTFRPKIVSRGDGKPMANKDDKDLLKKYGIKGLEKMGYLGVIDRLRNSKLI